MANNMFLVATGCIVALICVIPQVSSQAACAFFNCVNGDCIVNTAGVPSCQCYSGYRPVVTIPQVCIDIDECQAAVNPCGQLNCCNEAGTFRCIPSSQCDYAAKYYRRQQPGINPYLLLSLLRGEM